MQRIGAFEAKTHLSKLLERVQAGESIAITRHGKEVARLVPSPGNGMKLDLLVAAVAWKKSRRGVRLRGVKVRDLIDEGRR